MNQLTDLRLVCGEADAEQSTSQMTPTPSALRTTCDLRTFRHCW
jgi:hypothetical protein